MNILDNYIIAQPKSNIKAGEAKNDGKYKFFNSSNTQTKYYDEYQYDKPALIFGTGGNASIHYCDEPFSTSTDCIVFYARNESVDLKLIYIFISSNMHLLESGFKGIGIKHISKSYIQNIEIKIPEKSVHSAITKSYDQICALIINRKKQLEKLDEFGKSRFIEMFGDPINPKKRRILGDIALLERGRFSPRPRNDPKYYNGEYPFIQTGDIANSGHRLSKYKQTLNEAGIKVSKKFSPGTIVIAIVGATIGATAILEREVYAPDSIIGITVNNSQYDAIFLETLLQFWQPELHRIAPESARANINLAILNNIPIIDVDITKQKEFVMFIKKIDSTKSEVQKSLDKLEMLKNALIQKYFG